MNSGELHHKIRTRRASSDSTSAGTSAAGTSKVNPTYGDTGATGAQQVVRAAADQLDYRSRLYNWRINCSCVNYGLPSGLAYELVASLEDGWR